MRKRAEFLRIQGNARRVSCAHFVLLVAARPEGERAGPSRLGLVVSKKVGDAVARNRTKRVCRECFRASPGLVPDGVDLVVIAKEGADALGLAGVRAEWDRAARQLHARAVDALASAAKADEARKSMAEAREATHVPRAARSAPERPRGKPSPSRNDPSE